MKEYSLFALRINKLPSAISNTGGKESPFSGNGIRLTFAFSQDGVRTHKFEKSFPMTKYRPLIFARVSGIPFWGVIFSWKSI